jgi:hypothetical protein
MTSCLRRSRLRGPAWRYKLLDLTRDPSVLLEEYARKMIVAEELHVGEVAKMLQAG